MATIPKRIQTEAGREQFAQARAFSQPVPLAGSGSVEVESNTEVERIRAMIFKARDQHAALLDNPPELDKFVKARMEQTGERSYSAALAEIVAIAREVRTLAAQFESPEYADAEVARVTVAHVEASKRGGNVTFAQVLREADDDA